MGVNTILLTIALLFVGLNVFTFFRRQTYRQTGFDMRLFSHLFVSLLGVMIGFALIYYALSRDGVILVTSLETMNAVDPNWRNLLYFSGVTLLSIGFGDLLPIGPARLFALLEAAIGILLPTAFFVKSIYKKED
ncbi:MAG: potassium channel family protein [Exiguobacterium sp.]|uniref:ion channel n=1 Tax=Exiguobacterium TaxID=33986 RepID=UPI0009FF0E9A|nr:MULTISPECIES: ion channel [unclassified Exiguobacterium]MDX5425096.1 potassium channel family protein [Exiguobacterium sp.]MDX6772524.1 potassium channel family protein [Exiguobacterium sp.]